MNVLYTTTYKIVLNFFLLTKNLDMCGTPHFVVMVVRRKSSNNIEQMVQQPEMEILYLIIIVVIIIIIYASIIIIPKMYIIDEYNVHVT